MKNGLSKDEKINCVRVNMQINGPHLKRHLHPSSSSLLSLQQNASSKMTKTPTKNDPMSQLNLLTHDAFVSFIWVCSGSIIRYIAYQFLGLGAHNPIAILFKGSLAVLYLVFFAWLRKLSRGAYNPLMVLCYGISGSFSGFIFTVFARIPAQVVGSIIAVWFIMLTFPEAAHPPHLNVDIQRGTLTEGLLAFMIVTVSLALKKKDPKHSARKTWIKSISKVVLHLIGSEITGGMMNPAAAFGWAYFQGNYNTKEHVYVYWLAPIEATLLGVWTCSVFVKPKKQEQNCKISTNLERSEAFGWMDARGDLLTRKPSSRQLVGRMDVAFCFQPKRHRE